MKKAGKTLEVALADSSGTIKALVYDDLLANFTEGDILLIRGFQKGKSASTIMLNRNTKAQICPQMTVPDQMIKEAELLLADRPPPDVTPIENIHDGNFVTIHGTITHVRYLIS